jgi:geranylgeranyl pyrophosphate synthase
MDNLELALTQLLDLDLVRAWPAAQTLLRHAAHKRSRHWQIPAKACEAVGGAGQATPAVTAMICLHTSIMLVDDMLDADPRGEYHRLGMAAAANLAAAFQALGLDVLARAQVPRAAGMAALQSFNQAALTIAFGQQLDSENPADEAAYWRVVDAKSAPFFAAALHIGALIGGAAMETAGQLRRLGQVYGEMIQIHDDLTDVMQVPANPDWILGRSPLPILFARTMAHPERTRFVELCRQLQAAVDPAGLREAQAIIIRCGAIGYSIYELQQRHQRASELLDGLALPQPAILAGLLEDAIRPVERLFAAVAAG